MLCQACKKADATVRCTQVVNNKKTEISLCAECAEKSGLIDPLAGLPELFGKIFAHIIGEELPELSKVATEKPRRSSRKCPSCGYTLARFERTGLLGCSHCYVAFEPEIKVVLRRYHGSNQHIGNRPRSRRVAVSKRQLQNLRHELQQAIQEERYERAAELRNLIRDAEAGQGSSGSLQGSKDV